LYDKDITDNTKGEMKMIYCHYFKGECNINQQNSNQDPAVCVNCNNGKGTCFKEYFLKVDKEEYEKRAISTK